MDAEKSPNAKKHDDFDLLVKVVIIGDSGVGKSNILTRFTSNTFCESSLSTIGMSFATRVVTFDPDNPNFVGDDDEEEGEAGASKEQQQNKKEDKSVAPEAVEEKNHNNNKKGQQQQQKRVDKTKKVASESEDGPEGSRKRVKMQVWDTAGQERHRALMAQYYRGAVAALLVYDVTSKRTFQSVQRWLLDLYKYTDEKNIVVLLVGNKTDLKQRTVTTEEGKRLAEQEGLFFIETSAKDCTNIEHAFHVVTEHLLQSNPVTSPSVRERRRKSLLVDGVEIGADEPKKGKDTSGCGC